MAADTVRLLSGSLQVRVAPEERSFATVSGETAPDSEGELQMTFDAAIVGVSLAHTVGVRLAESHARAIGRQLLDVVARLEHLRALHRRGALASETIAQSQSRWSPSRPSLSSVNGEDLVVLATIPIPAREPELVLRGSEAAIRYVDANSESFAIVIANAHSARRYNGSQGSASTVARRVRSNAESDEEQFVISFPTVAYAIDGTEATWGADS